VVEGHNLSKTSGQKGIGEIQVPSKRFVLKNEATIYKLIVRSE